MHMILCEIPIKAGIALHKQRHNKLAHFNHFPNKYSQKNPVKQAEEKIR